MIIGEFIVLGVAIVLLVGLYRVGPEWNFKKLLPRFKNKDYGKINKDY